MALIKCPECGREGVSEYAEACPSCGFVIREYVQLVKKREEEERERLQKEKEEKERRAERKVERKIKYDQKIKETKQSLQDKLEKLEVQKASEIKPRLTFTLDLGSSAFFIVVAFISGQVTFNAFTSFTNSLGENIGKLLGGGFFLVVFLGCISMGLILPIFDLSDYHKKTKEYKAYLSDWEGYKEKKKKELIEDNKKLIEEITLNYETGNDF